MRVELDYRGATWRADRAAQARPSYRGVWNDRQDSMIDFFLYRVIPVLFAVFVVLLLIPHTSVRIIQFVSEWYYRF